MAQPENKTPLQFGELPDDALLRLAQLVDLQIVPFSATTLWRKCRQGEFPAPVKVSDQITAWRVGQIRLWLRNPTNFKTSHLR